MQESLNISERSTLKKGEDSFIGREVRDAKLWDEQLEQEREKKRQKYKDNPYDRDLQRAISPTNVNGEAAGYGMPPRPEAPDKDYLSCFHQQWDESKVSGIQRERRKFLLKKKCSFHYPFGKMRGGTLAACEKNRKDAQERSRFWITTILIIVTIVLGALAIIPAPKKPGTTQPMPGAPAPQPVVP